jgi:hypothetical protein
LTLVAVVLMVVAQTSTTDSIVNSQYAVE